MARRQGFGNVSKLPSGRYRARYRDPRAQAPQVGPWVNAPYTFTLKAEAEQWLARARTSITNGTWQHPDDLRAEAEARESARLTRQRLEAVTVAEWAEQWLAARGDDGQTAPGTLRSYRDRLKNHVLPAFGGTRLTDLTPQAVAQWHKRLPSSSTRTNVYRTMRAMLNAAVESPDTALSANPCQVKGVDTLRGECREKYLFSPDEVAALADAINPRARALVLLSADAGLRINEALALRLSDLEVGGGAAAYVNVRHSVTRSPGGRALGPTKTRRTRRVGIMRATADALADHVRTYCGDPSDLSAFVFPSPASAHTPLADRTVDRWLRQALPVAGVTIPDGRQGGWHAFRHYAATRFGQTGATVNAIMSRFGWVKVEQAMHYQRSDADYERDMIDRMALATSASRTWSGRSASVAVVRLDERRSA